MKYIIMCGGHYTKWSTPRHLTEIDGEPVVGRTIRLLKEYGVDDIAISTSDERFADFGVPLLKHHNPFVGYGTGGTWVDAFYPTSEPACYLMGDVVFSTEAIRKIVETQTDSILFFASRSPFPKCYIKRWAEPFAFKVVDQIRFRKAIDFCRENESTGYFQRRPISWELWQVLNGGIIADYTVINDYTCDIDEPEDAEKIERAMKQWQMYNR